MADTPEWITATQTELQTGDGALISRPKLTTKLLERPPFKFLHDVFTNVQASTGFAPGLLDDEESDKDKVNVWT